MIVGNIKRNTEDTEGHQLNLEKVLETQKKLRKIVATKIKFSEPILEQNGNPVIFPHTINVIQGQAGQHKSRVAENICAALLKQHDCKNELLGFIRFNSEALYTVVYVDTERNISEQLPFALQSIQIKAGYKKEDELSQFQYISLLTVTRKERFKALKSYLKHLRKSDSNMMVVILDVSTDCIEDFNRIDKSMELIDLMNISINETKVTFICIIHENPGSEKSRGHFGTELMNKATTLIQVGFEKDASQNAIELIRAKYLKCRNTAKHKPFYFKYCQVAQGLVLATNSDVLEASNNRRRKADINDVIEQIEIYFSDCTTITKVELFEKLRLTLKVEERTLADRIKEIIETKKILINQEDKECYLDKKIVKKEVTFSLKTIESQ